MTVLPPHGKQEQVDLLLLNCSNLVWRPIYPYAFVQLAEVGRRHGLKIVTQDMLYVADWKEKVHALVSRMRPRAIGIHLRQADTVDLSDYHAQDRASAPAHFGTYFPVEDSRRLVALLRDVTDAPIMMGGFGFTTHATRLMQDLDIDLGVAGCPDGMVARFEDVLLGRDLASVPNLIHRQSGRIVHNTRIYAAPAQQREYTDAVLTDIRAFYGEKLRSDDPPTIAVEVSRGCPFACFFCTEPAVKGNTTRFRDLEVVEDELAYLLSNDFRHFWFVCSELNIRGAGFAFDLAERVIRLNERFPGPRPIRWSGYSLPSFTAAELATLKRAGYTGAINDILSLDDANLRRARVPYKSSQALEFMRAMIDTRAAPQSAAADSTQKFTANSPDRFEGLVSFFLGNAHMDAQTIPRTLEKMEASGLQQFYNEGYVIPSTRTFPTAGTASFFDTPTTVTYGPKGIAAANITRPSFHFPPYLMDRLGSREAVIAYLDHLAQTFMSSAYRVQPKWARWIEFQLGLDNLLGAVDSKTVKALGLPIERGALLRWLQATDAAKEPVCLALIDAYFLARPDAVVSVQAAIPALRLAGSRPEMSEYRMTQVMYDAFPTRAAYDRHIARIASEPAKHFQSFCETWAGFRHDETFRDLTFGALESITHD